ncbi:MAG TPA: hypothetical protein VK508_18995 [Cyclobacteriaceae bacterium]|nr:hypothetical protein [Cyclobacteriaceae bacterium]
MENKGLAGFTAHVFVGIQGKLEGAFDAAGVALFQYGLRFSEQPPVPGNDFLLFFNNISNHLLPFYYVPFNPKFALHFWEFNQKMGVFQAFPDGGLFKERGEKNSGSYKVENADVA